MPDIAALLAEAKPREARVPVCLAGDLVGEHEALHADLAAIGEGWAPSSIADVDPRVELVRRIEDLRGRMREQSATFRLVSLGRTRYADLLAQHPSAEGSREPFDPETFFPALLAASCAEPEMTLDQVGQLLDVVNNGQAEELFAAALRVNEEPSPLPF